AVGTHDVDAGNVRVDVAWHRESRHLAPVLRVAEHALGPDHAGAQDRLLVIDVAEEKVERAYTLRESRFEHGPFVRGNDARHEVEWNQTLGAGLSAIHGERDADAMKDPLGLAAFLRDAVRRRPRQPVGER